MTTGQKIIHWTPRVLVFAFAAFVSLFAFDVWEIEGTIWERIAAFLVHLTPVYFIIAAGLIGWKRPLIGGIACLVIAVAMATVYRWWQEPSVLLLMGLPLVITGLLFIVDDRMNQPRPRLGV